MPTQLEMNPSDDLDQLSRWHERLPVYARTQGSYLNDLLAQGFDQEQAFLLVRDWSSRTMYWACDARQAFPEAPDFIPLDAEDPSCAQGSEEYLIAAIDPPFGSQPLRQEDLGDLTNVVQLDRDGNKSNQGRDGEVIGQKPLFDDVEDTRLDDAA